MATFSPIRASQEPCEDEEASCERILETSTGRALRVTDKDTLCEKDLVAGCEYPSIPVQLNETTVELRDGSVSSPIKLPNLQKQIAGSFTGIVITLPDGTVKVFKPADLCGRYRLVVENGIFKLIDDGMSDVIIADICEAECNDVDFVIGAIRVPITCNDGTTKNIVQLKLIPRCCCDSYLVGVNDDAGGIE